MPAQDPQPGPHEPDPSRRRRQRYPGTHPRQFQQRYKELAPERYPGIIEEVRERGATPAGTHVPILLEEAMTVLAPLPGEIVADCTLGYGGHTRGFAQRVGAEGRVYAFDVDAGEMQRTRERLADLGERVSFQRSNFAGLAKVMLTAGIAGYDIIFADLGVSSMQVDNPDRGFSYKHDGPLDMRMDDRLPRTAAELLKTLSLEEIAEALDVLADEPDHLAIARRVVEVRERHPILRTSDLTRVIFDAKNITARQWRQRAREKQSELHPAARSFQALRILVNDELGSLRQLLRIAPSCLRPGGRIGLITFHSGEDRLVERAFQQGLQAGTFAAIANEPIRPSSRERYDNPRSSSARLRWALAAAASSEGPD